MKSVISAVALLSFVGVAALPTSAFARTTHHPAQTHLVSAKKTHKAKTTAHKKSKKKSDGVPS